VNTRLITTLVLAGTLLAPLVARAEDSDADRKHPVAFVKDSIITTKVKAKLAAEKLRTLARVRVDTDRNGMVVLSGTAKTQAIVDRAGAIARDTEGVSSVQNDIRIK
jgi:hyperosmotically inducible periplasmic protein